MKVTNANIKDIKYIYDYHNVENAINLLDSLLIDLMELNQLLENNGKSYKKLYIDYIDKPTEYSVERTDPCPDFYGQFRLKFENNPTETAGDIMTLNELDTVLCALINFIEY